MELNARLGKTIHDEDLLDLVSMVSLKDDAIVLRCATTGTVGF